MYSSILQRVAIVVGPILSRNIRMSSSVIHEVDQPYEKATFGMGCFWACDSLFGGQQGVLRTKVGYAGGTTPKPTYKSIGDHTEVIEIHYNPEKITYETLLNLFWDNHEYGLTTKVRRQYMSLVLYHNEEQKRGANETKLHQMKKQDGVITEIKAAGEFFAAEDYHQKYRLQQHTKLCDLLQLNSKLLQTSTLAARLNGYLAGIGSEENLLKDLKDCGCTDSMIEYAQKTWRSNKGGNLYC